jgi:hypothetical protein
VTHAVHSTLAVTMAINHDLQVSVEWPFDSQF